MQRVLVGVVLAVACGGNTAPSVDSVRLEPGAPTTEDAVSAVVEGVADVDGDEVGLSFAWTVNGEPVEAADTLPATAFARGDTLVVTVTPFDEELDGEPVSSTPVEVQNSAPSIGRVAISPAQPTSSDTLDVEIIADDPDGDTLTYTYTWFVDGAEAGSGSTLSGPNPRGSIVEVEVVASDGDRVSEPRRSDPVTTTNSPPPTPPAPTLLAGEGWLPVPVTCVVEEVVDPDGDPVNYVVEFLRDGTPGDTFTAENGEATVGVEGTSRGGVWTCRVRARDDAPSSSEWSAESEGIDLSCDADSISIRADRAISLAHNNGTWWEDDTLQAYTYGSDGGNDDIVGWSLFDLGDSGSIRGVQDAELVLRVTGTRGPHEVVVVQTDLADNWGSGSPPTPSDLERTGEVSDPRGPLVTGDTVRLEIDLAAWTDGPGPEKRFVSLGVDNLAEVFSYAYFASMSAPAAEQPRLDLTVCR